MKLKLATIFFAASVMVSITSCEEKNLGEAQLPPLAGEVVLTDVLGTSGSRVSPNYVLGVELGNSAGAVLEAKFASPAPTLQSGAYTEASASYATAGNYITGADGTTLTINGEKHLVTAGTINLNATDGSYTLKGIVKLNNGENYSISWTGSGLTWNDLPQLKQLTQVTSAQSNLANGVKTITLNLSDGNWTSEMDMTTYQTVYKGKGNYLALDIYSEDGYLAAGTYKPCSVGGVVNKGEYGIGYDTTVDWGFGPMEMKDWGTCWWTVDEAAIPQTSAEKITSGDITVALNGTVYTITVDNGDLYAQFVGEIPAVTKPAAPADPWEMKGDIVVEHTEGLSFTMTDDTANNTQADGTTPLSGVTLYFVEVKDAAGKNVAILDLVTKEGAKSIAGEYKVTSYPDEVGEAGNGFDLNFPEWGLVMSGGTIVYDNGNTYVIDADKSQIKVTENKGQTTIIIKGTTTNQTTYETKTIAAKYVIGEVQEDEGGDGEGSGCGCDCDGCKDCTGGSGEGGDDEGGESFSGVQLAQFLYLQPGTGLVTVYLGDPGMAFDSATGSVSGVGNYLKFDVYSADGTTVVPGTYYPCAVAGTVTEGTFGIGWDPGDLWGIGWVFTNWGTCYMTKAEDGSETGVKIEDGTLSIEENGGNYVITVKSSAMNIKYEGPLA